MSQKAPNQYHSIFTYYLPVHCQILMNVPRGQTIVLMDVLTLKDPTTVTVLVLMDMSRTETIPHVLVCWNFPSYT